MQRILFHDITINLSRLCNGNISLLTTDVGHGQECEAPVILYWSAQLGWEAQRERKVKDGQFKVAGWVSQRKSELNWALFWIDGLQEFIYFLNSLYQSPDNLLWDLNSFISYLIKWESHN